jgi:hypothetical protein
MQSMHRQGDILFIRDDETDLSKATTQTDGIVARGEVTGHTHALETHKAALMLLAGAMYIKAWQDAQVLHQEHGPVLLEKGTWRVQRQREYRPDGWERVAD